MDPKIDIIKCFPSNKLDSPASLPLQMALHFNVYFSPFLFVISVCSMIMKYPYLSVTYQIILVFVLFVFFLVEAIRLLLGYYGNLGEKIPALSGFWTTSLVLQLPVSCFLLFNPSIYPLPIERAVYGIHLIFLLIEILTGLLVIRSMAAYQIKLFKALISEEVKG